MESTIGLFKTEVIDHEQPVWRHWREVENATASWVHWYNHERLHSSIGDIPPAEYEQQHYDSTEGTTTPSPPNNALHRIQAGSRRCRIDAFVALQRRMVNTRTRSWPRSSTACPTAGSNRSTPRSDSSPGSRSGSPLPSP